MRVKETKVFFFIFLLILLFPGNANSQEDKSLYYKGIQAAQNGELDFAFIHFYSLIKHFNDSEYLKEALFGAGEYYFSIGDNRDACQVFSRLINNYPEFQARPFAIAYLINITKKEGQKDAAEKLEKELVSSQQLSLLFRDFEELLYLSPLSKNYQALYFIDKIEIYIDNELFTEIFF